MTPENVIAALNGAGIGLCNMLICYVYSTCWLNYRWMRDYETKPTNLQLHFNEHWAASLQQTYGFQAPVEPLDLRVSMMWRKTFRRRVPWITWTPRGTRHALRIGAVTITGHLPKRATLVIAEITDDFDDYFPRGGKKLRLPRLRRPVVSPVRPVPGL